MKAKQPTGQEQSTYAISAYRGIDVALGQAEPLAELAAKIAQQHPGHLVLIQAGTFLHGFDKTAYALHVLKKYKLKLVGTTSAPHLRIGFPAGRAERRLWSIMNEFDIPYVVALGNQKDGYQTYGSKKNEGNASVLGAVTDDIVHQVILDLQQINSVNVAATKKLLANPSGSEFDLKTKALDLETLLMHKIIRMPRDVRAVYGENLRACLARIIRNVFAYGKARNKYTLLLDISADVDVIKYHLTQASKINNLQISFESAVTLSVGLGQVVGGLINAQEAAQ
ncbi:four helix bundle protein [Paracandidimonas soli]|uniref:Uncharacterized protein n=1 Tax=Paracandidimonas soli TaxID=1917182 RepID=A0A4R3US50_9BURK|nr:four helix bundle protein [Paracandidimonas soli]TCU93922.1 hypothetical protein EV686_11090 [Paracandidimonas soli]